MILKLSTAHFLVKHTLPIVGNKNNFYRTLILHKLCGLHSVLVLKAYIFEIMCVTLHLILHLP